MDSLNSFSQGLNPLNFLGGAASGANPLGGADPLQMLMSLFGSKGSAGQAGDEGSLCSCGSGAASNGATNVGCSCCQKNESLGF